MERKDEYVRQLEETIAKFMVPLEGIPFSIAIKAISGYEVIPFDKQNKQDVDLLGKLRQAADIAGKQASQDGIFRRRPNEVGNDIEPYVKEALKAAGLQADTPINSKTETTSYGLS